MSEHPIAGTVAPGFEGVRTAFIENFQQRGEIGAACAVYWRGEKVVDLWGGYKTAEKAAVWEADTLVLVFSTTKGLSMMAYLVAHSQGLFDFDEPVVRYWPEFAQAGKEVITIRQLLSHQAGLCYLDTPLTINHLADPDQMASIAARQSPAWNPGHRHGYHGISFSWYVGELMRRLDSQGRSLGQFFAEEVAAPMNAEFYIGLPESVPTDRIANIRGWDWLAMLKSIAGYPAHFLFAILNPWSLTARTFRNPKIMGDLNNYNRPDLRAVELPASNGIGKVRDIARLYGEFASGGKQLGIQSETWDHLMGPLHLPKAGNWDEVMLMPNHYHLGFNRPTDFWAFSPCKKAFGTSGVGGSFAFADPDQELGFAYAMNKAGTSLKDDKREAALRHAMYAALDRIG